MKILHFADLHLGDFPGPVINGVNARHQDKVRAMDFIVETAKACKPDVILDAGDGTDAARVWSDRGHREIRELIEFYRKLSEVATVVAIFGTDTHISREAWETMREALKEEILGKYPIYLIDEPQVVRVRNDRFEQAIICCLPGYDRQYFLANMKELDAAEAAVAASNALADVMRGLAIEAESQTYDTEPRILLAHYTVLGCQYDGTNMAWTENEASLRAPDIDFCGFDLACLGHIHRQQRVQACETPTWYAGAPDPVSFNEEGQDKGLLVHEIGTSGVTTHAIKNPHARKLYTLYYDLSDDGYWAPGNELKDALVRVKYKATDRENRMFNRAKLESALRDASAWHIASIERELVLEDVQHVDALHEAIQPETALETWLGGQGKDEETIVKTLKAAQPIIDRARANVPSARVCGAFVPVSIDLVNYRSYRQEHLDFDRINFCIVNGPNGAGKSALVMDAMADALYEENREGTTGGWITNAPDVRSGSITFTFQLGTGLYQVSRSRTKSGKLTLSLAEQVDGLWSPRGGATARETQQAIIDLLGMDAQTFKSCVLIMQDAYAVFLEANREDRMRILSDALGLNIYPAIEEEARKLVTEARADIRARQAAMQENLEKAERVDDCKAAVDSIRDEIKEWKERHLPKFEEELAKYVEAQRERNDLAAKLDAVIENSRKATERIEELGKSRAFTQERLQNATEVISQEERINEGMAVLQKAESDRTALEASLEATAGIEEQHAKLQSAIEEKDAAARKRRDDMIRLQERIDAARSHLPEYEAYQEALAEKERLDNKKVQYLQLRMQRDDWYHGEADKLKDAEKSLDAIAAKVAEYDRQIELLNTSNCPIADKAECKFLQAAQRAKAQRPAAVESLEAARAFYTDLSAGIQAELKRRNAEINELGYDAESHAKVTEKVIALQKYATVKQVIDTGEQELARLKEAQDAACAELEELRSNLDALLMQMQERAEKKQQLVHVKNQIFELSAWRVKKEALAAAKAIEPELRKHLQDLDSEIAGIEKELKAYREEYDSYDAKLRAYAADAAADVGITRAALLDKVARARDYITDRAAALGKAQAEYDAAAAAASALKVQQKELKAVQDNLEILQLIMQAAGNDGIPHEIIRMVTPELEAMANSILMRMSGGHLQITLATDREQSSGRIVNALDVNVASDINGTMPYASFSGGQKVRVALAMVFALSMLKARRAGIQPGLLAVDEPSFLDAEGTDEYNHALLSMLEAIPGLRIIAISHDPRMKAFYPQQITVEMVDGVSRIVERP